MPGEFPRRLSAVSPPIGGRDERAVRAAVDAVLARGFWPPEAVEALEVSSALAGVGDVVTLLRASLPAPLWARVEAVLEPVYGLPLPGVVGGAEHPTLW